VSDFVHRQYGGLPGFAERSRCIPAQVFPYQLERLEIRIEELGHSRAVAGRHGPDARCLWELGQRVEFDGPRHGHVLAQLRKANFKELLRVQRAVVVTAIHAKMSADEDALRAHRLLATGRGRETPAV